MISTSIQIRFSDCDMLQHVNNAVYLQYFETARIQFFKTDLPDWDWKKNGIILLKNEVEYKVPLFLTDDCHIEIDCSHIGNKSFTLTYKVMVNNLVKSTGKSILVCFDFNTNQTTTLPTQLKKALQKHLTTDA